MVGGILNWIEERLRIAGQLKSLADEDMGPGVGYLHSLGSLVLSLMLLLVVTGIFLALNYSPSPDHAHNSIRFLERHVLFGKFLRGLHHWAASLAVIAVGLHALFVFFHAAYKKPRELTWVMGVCLFLIVLGFAFTGYLLPWDQKGYWASVVAAHTAGTFPIIGNFLERLLMGGSDFGAATLSRFFAIHSLILPALLLLCVTAHLFLVRRLGVSPAWGTPKGPAKPNKFYPHQIFRNMVLVLLAYSVVFALAGAVRAPLDAVANPNDTSYVPRPEWYFMPMFEFFKYFKGGWEPVGTIFIPLLLVIFLYLLPFLDRNPGQAPRTRPFAISLGALVVVVALVLGLLGAATPPPPSLGQKHPSAQGQELYAANNCSACHQLKGAGGTAGPPLDEVGKRRSRTWIIEHFKDPKALVPNSTMPSYGHLSDQQLEALTDYLLATATGAPSTPAPPAAATTPAPPGAPTTATPPGAATTEGQSTTPPPESGPAGVASQPPAGPLQPQPPIMTYQPQRFPLLGRSAAIGLVANFHIIFAAFLLGGPIVALFLEWQSLRRREAMYDHLARGLTKVMVICFSIGATFGVTLVVLLTGLFPRFWAGWLNIFFWPFVLEALMFFIEGASLYAYFYTWDRFSQRRRLHMSLVVINILSGTATMVIINAVAAAMLTPPADIAQRPWTWSTMYLSNPTWLPLTLHRFVANVSLTGFLIAMWAGYAYLRAKTPQQRAFRDLAGHVGVLLGLGGLFLLPPIGILYVLEIRSASPPGFVNLMLGPMRLVFNIQITLLVTLFVLSIWYLLGRAPANWRRSSLYKSLLAVSILSALLAITPYNIGGGRLIPLGRMDFKYLALSILGLITLYALATAPKRAQTLPWGAAPRAPQYGLVAIGLAAFLIMNVMGVAREVSRRPYLVFGQMQIGEEEKLGQQAVSRRPYLPPVAPPQTKAETPPEMGARLYAEQGCAVCHVLQGSGGNIGPALDGVGTRRDAEWMVAHFKDPQALVPGSAMPKYDLPEEQLRALSDYLSQFK